MDLEIDPGVCLCVMKITDSLLRHRKTEDACVEKEDVSGMERNLHASIVSKQQANL